MPHDTMNTRCQRGMNVHCQIASRFRRPRFSRIFTTVGDLFIALMTHGLGDTMADAYRVRRIKGDIVEAICKNHFAAMGFQIENAGVEHFATKFANRSAHLRRDLSDSNVSKIQNYIGHLPDLLIGHDAYDHHFVEAKFRDSISIEEFSK